jgi:bifunctional UDP-N-acetylglucosamine pyrophosphorylase/glucosamine-1-phosphate N-acetyltransferase
MEAILLAAGQSTRLDPIGDKNLLEFSGEALVCHRVKSLSTAGFSRIIVVGGGHNLAGLRKALSGFPEAQLTEQKDLGAGMAGGVLAGAALVRESGVMVVSTNDTVDDPLFEALLSAAKNADGAIAGKKVDSYFPGGYLSLGEQGFITSIVEKPGEGHEPGNLVNMVVHYYADFPAFSSFLLSEKGDAEGCYERALQRYLDSGAKIRALTYEGHWQAIKYPWHILAVMRHFLSSITEPMIDPTAQISKTAVLNGNVVIGPRVKILDHAVVQGPAFIGADSMVATNALVRESMIGRGCVVGFSTEVARSYLNHGVWTHSNYLGDSVVDSNVSFGSGTVLGNLRFDEQEIKVTVRGEKIPCGSNKFGAVVGSGVRFGVNCSTYPGVKIGKDTFVGPGVCVDRDLKGGTLSLLQQSTRHLPNHSRADTADR